MQSGKLSHHSVGLPVRCERMVALKRNGVVDILSPKDPDPQKQVISLVLDNL